MAQNWMVPRREMQTGVKFLPVVFYTSLKLSLRKLSKFEEVSLNVNDCKTLTLVLQELPFRLHD